MYRLRADDMCPSVRLSAYEYTDFEMVRVEVTNARALQRCLASR